MYRLGRWQHYLTTHMYPQLSLSFLMSAGGSIVLSLQPGWLLKHTEQNKLWLMLLQRGCTHSNHLLRPLGLWEDTPLLCSWLVSPFYPGLHGPGHWLERCFSAHTALRGSDLNTSNNPVGTSAMAEEDWKHTRFHIWDTAKMGVHCFGGVNVRGRMRWYLNDIFT